MSFATLGFDGGPKLSFRIDPQAIDWNFQIHTSVTETVGGRVVHVTGGTLSDITISGLYGENRAAGRAPVGTDHPGASWRLAESFVAQVRAMMVYQAGGATVSGQLTRAPAVFSYPPQDWRFRVYIKALSDPDGGAVSHRLGKFSYGYSLTLFVVQDGSDALTVAGGVAGVVASAREAAIDAYIARVADGVGWHYSPYNGGVPSATSYDPSTTGGSP